MSQVQGVVISVTLSTQAKKQAGGTYEAWELVYKTLEGEVRSLQKPVQGLKFNAALANSLKQLSAGDEFTATLEKNAGGFLDVKGIVKGLSVEAAPPVAPAGKAQATNAYQGRDYETAAERAERREFEKVKQVLIVRQSSLSNAINTLSIGAKAAPKVEDILAVAEQYVSFVDNKSAAGGKTGFDDFDNDIPY